MSFRIRESEVLKRARDMKLKLEIELGLLQYFLEDWELESME